MSQIQSINKEFYNKLYRVKHQIFDLIYHYPRYGRQCKSKNNVELIKTEIKRIHQKNLGFRDFRRICLIVLVFLNAEMCKSQTHELLLENYGNDPAQKFNIFLPLKRDSITTPILFLIHGGYWRFGDPNECNTLIKSLQEMLPEYAFVSIGYRLYTRDQNKFPTQERDVMNCIHHVLLNHQKYAISENFAVYGSSAGAHLALLYSYKSENGLFRPKAAIAVSGITDLAGIFDQKEFDVIKRVVVDMTDSTRDASVVYRESSPLNYIKDGPTVPTLVMYGNADSVVPRQQSVSLIKELRRNKVPHESKKFRRRGHDLSQVQEQVEREISNFLRRHLR